MNASVNADKFSKIFFFVVPWTIPLIVTSLTYLFYPLVAELNLIWLPLLIIYWVIIWGYSLLYRKMKGGVFEKERFKITLFLKGKYLVLQYILLYGMLIFSIPRFITSYSTKLSAGMYLTLILASIINGFSEELYWRACLEDAGKNAGVSEKGRLIFAPIAFSFWHTAFVIHLFPWNSEWWVWWGAVLLMTWSSGIIWHWILHRSGRLMPQAFYHMSANFLSIFPLMLVDVLQFYF